MGNYNGSGTHRSASNSKANLGVVLGSVGSGLGLANYNSGCGRGCNNGGILGNLLGGGNNGCYVDEKEYAWGQAYNAVLMELGAERSERYTDQTTLELYKEQVSADKEVVAYVNALFERLDNKLEAKTEKNIVAIMENAKAISENDKEIALNKRDSEWQYAVTQKEIKNSSDSIRCYIDGNFVQGELIMPLDKICPAAQPKCEDVQLVELVSAAQAFAQAMGTTSAKATAK